MEEELVGCLFQPFASGPTFDSLLSTVLEEEKKAFSLTIPFANGKTPWAIGKREIMNIAAVLVEKIFGHIFHID